ncbi:sulfotransferase 1A2-like [Dreissena polymorpha]|nr:sulfotransferase 1A2-like [Dreissena polymorpha]
MTETKVLDAGGDPITMIDFGDFRSSLFGHTVEYIRKVNQDLPAFEFLDGDVLLVSYPKAGCTWTFEILTMLLKGKSDGPHYSKMHVMLEASARENMTTLPSPRLLNTHLPWRRFPSDIMKKKVKLVFVVRNPKDAAVSLYHMMTGMKHYNYSGRFENWLPLFMQGQLAYDCYLKYLHDWEEVYKTKSLDMFILYYEDLKRDSVAEIKRLAEFLELPVDERLVIDISEKCQFREMKTRFDAVALGSGSYKVDKNYGFMRKGEVGNWKQWFTVAQSEQMDALVAEKLHDSIFQFDYQ